MSDLGNSNYSETDASNSATPPNGFPEGMNPSDVNNSARADMGATKRFWDRTNSVKTTAGTNMAYTLTYDVAATALYDGEEFSFIINATCGGAPSLNINALGAKNLRKFTAGAYANLAASDIVANQIVRVRYNLSADKFDMLFASFSLTDFVTAAGNNTYTGTNDFTAGTTKTATAAVTTRDTTVASTAFARGTTASVNDAAYVVLATDVYVRYSAISTARNVTLPAASTFPPGVALVIVDDSGSASAANTISLVPNGTDAIDGSNTTQVAINIPRGRCTLVSNGSNGWDVLLWSVRYTNSLSGDVAMNDATLYFTGPTVAQGAVGRWRAYGGIVGLSTANAIRMFAKLWDGTAVICSAGLVTTSANQAGMIALSGILAGNPAGNLRISVRDPDDTSGLIKFNYTGNSADSIITVERIA